MTTNTSCKTLYNVLSHTHITIWGLRGFTFFGRGMVYVGEGRFMLENGVVTRVNANCYWLTERESQRTRFCNSQSRLSFVKRTRINCFLANSVIQLFSLNEFVNHI